MSRHKTIAKYTENTVLCALCKGKKFVPFLTGITTWEHQGVYNLDKCTKCGLVTLRNKPRPTEIIKYYPAEKYWDWDRKEDIKIVRKNIFDPLYKKILEYKSGGRILDVGAGSGIFLSEFKKINWTVEGTEISQYAAKIADKNFNIKYRIGEYTDLDTKNNYYDVITLNNVLEHLYNPKETLKKIHKELKHNGLIVITIPNLDGIGFSIFRKKWHALQPPRHLNHFDKNTITKIIEITGFKTNGYIYNFKSQNYYSIFESLRFSISPRFEKKSEGGLANVEYKWNGIRPKIIRLLGVYSAKLLTNMLMILEELFKKPDVLTIYAEKK